MGCGSCASGACGSASVAPKGCNSNGDCSTGGCNKLNSFDWLGNMSLPQEQKFGVVEVKFKSGKKDFFRNTHHLDLFTGDPVVVEMQSGYHIGFVSLQGELVRLQMKKKRIRDNDDVKSIYRKASEDELKRFKEVQAKEMTTMFRTREIIQELKLEMKLSDVEYQADNTKATFYYSADDRVDFRELIKLLASEFKVRVEMRQISLRQEASRLGGIGSCGRELCCSTWLTDFKSVSTSAARYQNLSLNPAKLSGQCGRLKCCLNYELETYLDALIDIPSVDAPLKLTNFEAQLQKVDIFKKVMWFSTANETNWVPVPAVRVAEILAMNKEGIKPDSFTENTIEVKKQIKPTRKTSPSTNASKRKNKREGNSTEKPSKINHTQKTNAAGARAERPKKSGFSRKMNPKAQQQKPNDDRQKPNSKNRKNRKDEN